MDSKAVAHYQEIIRAFYLLEVLYVELFRVFT